ncbi:unnamed protein product [Orchesella dallaii]|uniref:VWFC domain-containing protein n=1 Tax=Orchesella dallaii TaxID=48710 RepID=A0ABP1RY32_9HEXA
MSFPFGFLTSSSTAAGNVTNQTKQMSELIGQHCIDLHQRLVPHGVHFSPGPDECTLCACDNGEAKWCKAILCTPPEDCKSYKLGDSCCDFICLDDFLKAGDDNPYGKDPFVNRPRMTPAFLPKEVMVAAVILMSIYLALFLASRRRHYQIQGFEINILNMIISFGVLTTPSTPFGNVTNPTNQLIQPMGKSCIDLYQRRVRHGVQFSPWPDECALCTCVHGKAKRCKEVVCSPPQTCKSYKIGNSSCCDFLCFDDSFKDDLNRPTLLTRLLRNALILVIFLVFMYLVLFYASGRKHYRIEIQGKIFILNLWKLA